MPFSSGSLSPDLFLGATMPVSVVGVALGIVLLIRARDLGGRMIGACLLSASGWLIGAASELLSTTLAAFVLSTKLKFVGVTLTPLFLFLFVFDFFYPRRVNLRLGALASLIPALTLVLIWTNERHGLMWSHPPVDETGAFLTRPEWGAYFWFVHSPYSWVLAGSCVLLTLVQLSSGSSLAGSRRIHRTQMAILLAGVGLPLGFNLFYIIGGVGDARFSVTPLASALGMILITVAYFRIRLLGLQPIAHRTVFDQMAEGVLVLDQELRAVDFNRAALELLDRSSSSLAGRSIEETLSDEPELLRLLKSDDDKTHAEVTSGSNILEVRLSQMEDLGQRSGGRIVLMRDITTRKHNERRLRETEALLRGILERSSNGILRLRPVRDKDGRVRDFEGVFANVAALRYLGLEGTDPTASRLGGLPLPHKPMLMSSLVEVLRTGQRSDVELPFETAVGERWFRVLADEIQGDVSVTFIDVTERRRREQIMEEAALADPLTGLANRRAFEQQGERLFSTARHNGSTISLLYLDLDRFKQVNDLHGHDVGDELLREVAGSIGAELRPRDFAARLGGDEFAVLLPDTDRDTAERVAERVLRTIGELSLAGGEVRTSASVGIATADEHVASLAELLTLADASMYRHKRGTRQRA